LNWFFLAISAAFCWAIGGVLVKRGFSSVPPLWNNIINNALSIVIYIPAALLLSQGKYNLDISTAPLIAGASLLYQVFYYAISRGQISLTGTIVAGYPVFTILLAHLFIGERLLPLQYGGITLILAGGILIALPRGEPGKPDGPEPSLSSGMIRDRKLVWLLWGIFGAVSLGTGDFLAKLSIDRAGIFNYMVTIVLVSNIYSVLNYLIDRENRPFPGASVGRIFPTLSGLILNLIGFVFFLLAFRTGKVSLVAPVSSVYPALTALLAVRFLKERVTTLQGGGIALIVSGLILVGLS